MKVCPQCDEQYPGDVEFCAKDGAKLRSATESDEDPMIGRVLEGRYRIVERFSEGGMGAIYLARQETVGRQVAIKTLRTALADSQEFTDRFMREARVTSKISHPNCVTIHDFGQTDDTLLYLVMEYLEGETLADRLEREKLSTEDAIQIAIQVSNALEATHGQDVVHRDLKPDNIFLLDAAGERIFVKVLDFGISKVADGGDESLTKTGQVFGTPEYMSPEQGRSKSLDGRSDLYSLGCILYEVLSGSPPFRADTPMAVLVSHIQEEPRPLDEIADVPKALAEFVDDLLTKDVDERPASAAVVRRRLEEIRSDMAGNRPSESIGNVKPASEAAESSVRSSEGESNSGGTGGGAAADADGNQDAGENQDESPIDSQWGQGADSGEYESSGTSVWLAIALFVAFAVLLVGGAFAVGSFAYYEWGDGAVAAADAGEQSDEDEEQAADDGDDTEKVAESSDESDEGSTEETDEADGASGEDKPENWAELKKEFMGGDQPSEDGEATEQSAGTGDGGGNDDGGSGASAEKSADGAASPDETESGESESGETESAAGGSEESGGARPPDRVAGGESSQEASEEEDESTGEVATPSDKDESTASEETASGGSESPKTNEKAEETDQSGDESPRQSDRDESPGNEDGPETPPEETEEAEPPQEDQEPSAGQYVTSIQPSTSGPYCREGAIDRALQGAKTAFGECSKANGGVSAEMIFQFTVTSGGEILRTENYSTSMDQSAASCILNEVKGLSFGAQSGGNCTVRVTLQLQPP